MDHTANEIEAHMDRTRDGVGSKLRELEDRVDAATGWGEHFQARPHLFLGAAFIGGVMLGNAVRRASATREQGEPRPAVGANGSVQAQAWELWNNVQGALVGVASAGIKNYINTLIPGFDEHYRRAEQRTSAVDPTTTPFGRTTA